MESIKLPGSSLRRNTDYAVFTIIFPSLCILWIGGWVSPRASLDAGERKFSFRFRKSKCGCSAVHAVAHRYTVQTELPELPNKNPVCLNIFTIVRIVFAFLFGIVACRHLYSNLLTFHIRLVYECSFQCVTHMSHFVETAARATA
jgi:hypothetical protein